VIVRTGASVRLTHNSFEKNAFSDRVRAAFVVERDGKAEWSRNVFTGVGPEAIAGTDPALRALLSQANVFIGTRAVPASRPPAGRSGREQ